jgi:transcription-repair coupling factor (superfamily II helicase)
MRLKTELRRLRALACEVTTSLVTVHLRDDTPLDPAKLMKLMSGKASPYKLSPDMRLSRRSREIDAITNGLDAADRVLRDLSTCLRDGA